MKKVIHIFIVVLMILITSGMSSKNKDCLKVDDLINSNITSINNRNKQSYIEIINFDMIKTIWKEASEIDDFNSGIFEIVKNKKKLIKGFSMSYNMIIRTIEKIYNLKDWKFDLKSYEHIGTENIINHTIHKYSMKMEDNLGNKWKMKIFITEYNGCYYITEPVEANYLVRGW